MAHTSLGRGLFIIAAATLAGCAVGKRRNANDPEPSDALPLPLVIRFTLLGEDPLGLLHQALELATARWAAATGVDIAVSEPGASAIAVNTVQWAPPEEFIHPDGLFRVGHTDVWKIDPALDTYENIASSIHINSAGRPVLLNVTILHEMGHVLAQNMQHSATGLMSPSTHDPSMPIDTESLAFVCTRLPCAVMTAEV